MVQKKVIIIDDEEDLCHLMKAYLEDLNYEVHYSLTLGGGLKLLQTVTPDILFIDNNLPDGFGWDRIPYFIHQYPSCKINLISADNPTVVSTWEKFNTVRIIEKPLRLNTLKEYL